MNKKELLNNLIIFLLLLMCLGLLMMFVSGCGGKTTTYFGNNETVKSVQEVIIKNQKIKLIITDKDEYLICDVFIEIQIDDIVHTEETKKKDGTIINKYLCESECFKVCDNEEL